MALLDLAIECLKCHCLVLAIKRDTPSLDWLMHDLLWVGFVSVAPELVMSSVGLADEFSILSMDL